MWEPYTEKASKFSDYHLKHVMQRSWSYIKNSGDFIEEIKRISNIPDDVILVKLDVVGLYPIIPHKPGLQALEEALEKESLYRFPHLFLSKWQNLYFKIIILILMEKPNNKFMVLL